MQGVFRNADTSASSSGDLEVARRGPEGASEAENMDSDMSIAALK